MDRLLAPLSWASRVVNAATGGDLSMTLCRRSLEPDAPRWLLIVAAIAEAIHPGHLAWSAGLPPP